MDPLKYLGTEIRRDTSHTPRKNIVDPDLPTHKTNGCRSDAHRTISEGIITLKLIVLC